MILSVLSDPVKRREYDNKGMPYVCGYDVMVKISPPCLVSFQTLLTNYFLSEAKLGFDV